MHIKLYLEKIKKVLIIDDSAKKLFLLVEIQLLF